ncbi:FAD dependent oxidoreductase [Armillaria borealis]|uniref:FAD dependent oxidoreductase n=1 Tax=Armillaria borealis TaxID=47425 RepID=A0AA39MP33_9AGAR|nr:FAD dependent oxidoreductase [Armillaria borealis]
MVALFSVLRVAIDALREIVSSYRRVSKRIKQSPGLPVPNPTTPFWSIPASPIQKEGSSAALPACADIVIIGSGITGTAFARTLLDTDGSLEVVMLEARDACSGATARNGGHITPPLYHDYLELKKKHGAEAAKQIIQFRLSHLDELISVAEEEGLTEESQCRKVDTYDVYFDKDVFEGAKEKLGALLGGAAEREGWLGYDGRAGGNASSRTGCAGSSRRTGGAVHPYRLVTGNTIAPAQDVLFIPAVHAHSLSLHPLTTSFIRPAVISAPNISSMLLMDGTSHLLAPMREKIRSRERPYDGTARMELAWTMDGSATRSFVLVPKRVRGSMGLPHPTSRPNPTTLGEKPHAEFMFGGGIEMGTQSFFDAVGCADDSQVEFRVSAYLGGALAAYFGKWWGGESADVDDDHFERGRVKKAWSGVLGISVDGLPWVGSVPSKVSGRPEGREWIAAGYSGEGMVHTWMSGKALAYMVLGKDVDWLPAPFRVTEKRWRKANIASLL